MKLSKKVILILTGMWIVISLMIYSASKIFLSANFIKLENLEVDSNLHRVNLAFENLKHSLEILIVNWALWDDAYAFMKQKDEHFITSNFDATSFQNAKLNAIFVYDTKHQFYYGRYYDLIRQQFDPAPNDLLNSIQSNGIFNHLNDHNPTASGIIHTPLGYFIYTASSIYKSNGSGPSDGIFLMGFIFNFSHLKNLARSVQLPVTFYSFPITQSDPLTLKAYQFASKGETFFAPENNKIIYGYSPIKDVNNRPIAMLKIAEKRDFYIEGIKTIRYFLLAIILLGIGITTLVWYLLKSFILDRLINVSDQVVDIKRDAQFSKRITISGQDELTSMVYALNSLLELIELTQEQLTKRISQRTEKLERLVELNKNLFKEVNEQKAVEYRMKKDEHSLRQLAYYDNLTGLPNRMFFTEVLHKLIKKSEQSGTGFSLLFLDGDKFKHINDNYGHEIGDAFLKHVSKQLKKIIQDSDVAARLAGDEFIIILTTINERIIINMIAEKLLKILSEPMKEKNIEIRSSFSIGISIYPEDGTTAEELERTADLAMYYAKHKNGNAYFYASDIEKTPS